MRSITTILLLGAISAALAAPDATGRGLLQSPSFTYPVETTVVGICQAGTPGMVNYVGSDCGGGKILWDSMQSRTSDQVANGFTPTDCTWSTAVHGSIAGWLPGWIGSCGVKPTHVPTVPTHLYMLKIYKPRTTGCPSDAHHLAISEVKVADSAGVLKSLEYCGATCASGLVHSGPGSPTSMIDGNAMTTGVSSTASYCSEDHWVEFGIAMTASEAQSVAILSPNEADANKLQGAIVTITGPNKEQWSWTIDTPAALTSGLWGHSNSDVNLATYRNLALDGSTAISYTTGPGLWAGIDGSRTGPPRPDAVVDGVSGANAWRYSPTSQGLLASCATPYYVTVDLGQEYFLDHITAWGYADPSGDARKYCGFKVATSSTGDFTGEEFTIYEGAGPDMYGPESTAAGFTMYQSGAVLGRYVRWWMARSSRSGYPHFVELGVWGEVPPPPPPPFNGAKVFAGGCPTCAVALTCDGSSAAAPSSPCANAVDSATAGAAATEFVVAAGVGLCETCTAAPFITVRPGLPMRVTGVNIADRVNATATAVKDLELTFLPNGETRTVTMTYISSAAPGGVEGGNGMIAQHFDITPPVEYAETVKLTVTSEYSAAQPHGFTDLQLEGAVVPPAAPTPAPARRRRSVSRRLLQQQ